MAVAQDTHLILTPSVGVTVMNRKKKGVELGVKVSPVCGLVRFYRDDELSRRARRVCRL